MNRRLFLTLLMVLLLSLSLFPSLAQAPVTLRVMTKHAELTPEQIAAFEAENPDIHLEFIEYDQFTLNVSIMSGDVPDVLRIQANELPGYVENEVVLDITDYLASSNIISFDDLVSAADYYKFNDHYYGLPKDWSLDFSIYVYNPAFEAAGIPIPSTNEPLTYAELADIARQLTVRDGTTVTDYGLFVPYYERTITSVLMTLGTSMFNEDLSELVLVDNPVAMDVIRFFYDLTLEGVLNPDRGHLWYAWSGTMPMFQWGYWYGGSIGEGMPMYGQLTMLPAPVWDRSLPRLNTTVGPTGLAIMTGSQHPDEAYRFLEWYIAGEGGRERTTHGWGVPTLFSMFDLLPQDTPFNQQRFRLLQSEMRYSDWVMPIYPYQTTELTFDSTWEANIALALQGAIDFETFASNLQEEVNLAILNEQFSTP